MHQTPLVNTLQSIDSSKQTTVISESPKDTLAHGRGASISNLQDTISSGKNTLIFRFDDSAQLLADMATVLDKQRQQIL